jgi:alpha-ribazole phosphatase CobZ
MNIIRAIEKDYGVFINSPNGFLAISDFAVGNGINVVNNVNVIKSKNALDKMEMSDEDDRLYIAQEMETINFFKEYFNHNIIYTFLSNDVIIEDFTDKLQVANSPKGFGDAKIDISHVIYVDKILTKKDLIKLYKKVSGIRARYLASLNLPLHINNILNTNDFLAVLCNIPKDGESFDEINFDELNIEEAIESSIDEAFKRLDLTFGVLDYLVSEGILIGDLIDAGMELLPDDEVTPALNKKMEEQLLKALSDINVTALLMAAIRTEQDFNKKRIRELEVDDNLANLYTPEILGLSISNQIAGTRATFNFNHYYRLKPGILAFLPPMLDEIFAGLIAGCMSRIMED